jgi:hypothetical protein
MFRLTEVNDFDTRFFSSNAVLNVLKKVDESTVEIAKIGVKYLRNLCKSSDQVEIKELCIIGFCIISQFAECRAMMHKLNVMAEIDFDVAMASPELSYAFAATCSNMSMDPESLAHSVPIYARADCHYCRASTLQLYQGARSERSLAHGAPGAHWGRH